MENRVPNPIDGVQLLLAQIRRFQRRGHKLEIVERPHPLFNIPITAEIIEQGTMPANPFSDDVWVLENFAHRLRKLQINGHHCVGVTLPPVRVEDGAWYAEVVVSGIPMFAQYKGDEWEFSSPVADRIRRILDPHLDGSPSDGMIPDLSPEEQSLVDHWFSDDSTYQSYLRNPQRTTEGSRSDGPVPDRIVSSS